ncbi:hypothetical protein FRC18_008184 [Serendipita sp. 400]|nr:hypothetical protein FRC18_008184 [Serendipita sp. 400]
MRASRPLGLTMSISISCIGPWLMIQQPNEFCSRRKVPPLSKPGWRWRSCYKQVSSSSHLWMDSHFHIGKVRTIGVSNFSVKTLEILLPHVKVVPAVNQIEMNPCLPNDEVFEYCKKKGIAVTAYTPMGRPDAPFYTSPIFLSISEKYNAAVGQILLSWSVQRGAVPIPKSSNPERAKRNITLVKLASEDMAQIDLFHKQEGMHRTLCHRKRVEGTTALFGWTFEQLGWNLGEGGVALE